MILDLNRVVQGNINQGTNIQLHPEYITLEPFLTDAARKLIRSENRTFVIGQALSLPLEILKSKIARIEKIWKIQN